MGMSIRGLRELEVSVGKAQVEVVPKAHAVIAKGAVNIKKRMRRSASASRIAEARALSRTIDYTQFGLAAEIGPRTGHAGSLAFLYYGNSKNGPVLKDPGDALKAETPAVEKHLADIIGGLL